ncbi:hypothetical protein SDC9_169233 [bioreactor metagenome]|uniref:4-vinyl reductase 4VR domain-containing protein n=1 Tax=bioreactor metagenome TaxID=1076179 RepID=A0A645G4Q4_9ZZZZ
MRQVLREAYGEEQTAALFRRAGQVAGSTFALGRMKLDMGLDAFAAQLQQVFSEEKIGILRLEEFDSATGRFVLTVGEDLGCSGLPVTNEMVCSYDEGFLAGILKEYTGVSYSVKEIDCWANGGRVCRFQGVPGGEGG